MGFFPPGPKLGENGIEDEILGRDKTGKPKRVVLCHRSSPRCRLQMGAAANRTATGTVNADALIANAVASLMMRARRARRGSHS